MEWHRKPFRVPALTRAHAPSKRSHRHSRKGVGDSAVTDETTGSHARSIRLSKAAGLAPASRTARLSQTQTRPGSSVSAQCQNPTPIGIAHAAIETLKSGRIRAVCFDTHRYHPDLSKLSRVDQAAFHGGGDKERAKRARELGFPGLYPLHRSRHIVLSCSPCGFGCSVGHGPAKMGSAEKAALIGKNSRCGRIRENE